MCLRRTLSDDASFFIRLYLDEDVHKRVAAALRLRHFDVISAHEIDRLGANDDVQLQFAAENDRTLFTFNTTHYLHLHQVWLQENKEHAGIIVSDQLPIGETIRRLLNLLRAYFKNSRLCHPERSEGSQKSRKRPDSSLRSE